MALGRVLIKSKSGPALDVRLCPSSGPKADMLRGPRWANGRSYSRAADLSGPVCQHAIP
jgi:hypothetical protein